MNNGKIAWSGNFVAVATPFTASGAIDDPMFRTNIALMIDEGADGVVICGCTGEAWSLEPEERLHLFTVAREVAGKDVPVIGGTSGVVTQKVIDLSKAAIQAGCDGVLLMPPYYAVIGEREIYEHYKAISDDVRAPMFLYNMPKRTNINMSSEFLSRLADLEWVVALKQSSNDFNDLTATLAACGDRISVFAGHSAERGLAAIMLGCPGFVSSMEAQIMGREAISMATLGQSGKVEEGRRVQARTMTLDRAMRKIGTFPSNMKGAMNLLGRPGGYCRAPLLDLDNAELARAEEVLNDLGLMSRANAA